MKKLNIIFLFTIICSPLRAQKFTIKDCIGQAIANSAELKTSILQFENAQNMHLQAKRNILPSLSFGIEQSGNFGRSIDRFTNSYISQFYNSTYSGVQFSMPVFNSFQNRNDIALASTQIEAGKQGIDVAKNLLTLNIISAYMTVLGNIELLHIAENQLLNISNQKQRVDKLLAAGIATSLEEIQIRNQQKTDEISLAEAEMNFEISKTILFQLMNIPYNANAIFEDNFALIVNQNLLIDQEKSIENLPEIKQLNLMYSAQNFGLKSLKANNLPSIRLSGGYGLFYASSNKNRTFTEQLNDTRNGSLSVGLNIPLFRNFINTPRIQNLQIQQKLTFNAIEKTKNQNRQQIETAQITYKAAQKRWQNAQDLEKIASSTMQLVKQQIENGTVKMLDFLIAQANLEKASSAAIQAKYRLLLQHKVLEFYATGSFSIE